jgi:GrpB-like predicted nucleotidyltransferase (UPF0157 family)
MAAAIEHVGSTAVPDLPAKPIIDIDVLLATETEFDAVIDRLAKLGYVHEGNLGIPEREAFAAPVHDVPHHLYVCPPGSRAFQQHLAFRDYLRAHPIEAKAYADLKRSLALQFRDDRPAYSSGKSAFVAEIVSRAIQRTHLAARAEGGQLDYCHRLLSPYETRRTVLSMFVSAKPLSGKDFYAKLRNARGRSACPPVSSLSRLPLHFGPSACVLLHPPPRCADIPTISGHF